MSAGQNDGMAGVEHVGGFYLRPGTDVSGFLGFRDVGLDP